jgi:acetyltransferase-like isoleucine patch superfamily enzyme
VKIGSRVKLENRATLYEGVTIGNDVFIGPHVTFTNDLYPRSLNNKWKIIQTIVRNGSSIGARTVVVCGVTIGKHAMIGAGSVVTQNIPAYALAYGNPARIKGFVCTCGKKLEIKKRKENNVLMICSICNTEYKIPTKDYSKIEKEN